MRRARRPRLPAAVIALVASAAAAAGCDLSKLTADQTTALFERAAPGVEQHWDYELVGEASPGNILQLEGLLRVSPNNQELILLTAQAYASYAYGWVEDEAEVAERAGDYEEMERLQDRAMRLYRRARNLMFRLIRLREDGFDRVRQDPDALAGWLDEKMSDDDDAEALFWLANAWGSMIGTSLTDPDAIADISVVQAVARHVVALDETTEHAGALLLLGSLQCRSPSPGVREEGAERFERALELTERKYLIVQVNYAHTCARVNQDRAAYVGLLREVLAAGDPLPETRLANRIAKRRARRYLAMTDELFL